LLKKRKMLQSVPVHASFPSQSSLPPHSEMPSHTEPSKEPIATQAPESMATTQAKAQTQTQTKELMTTQPALTETNVPNFTGKWVLETTENLDKYLLESEGWGWLSRKLAGASWYHQNIQHDVNTNTIKVRMTNPKHSVTYTAIIGGNPVEFVDLSGYDSKVTLSWNADKTILIINCVRIKEHEVNNTRLIERWIDLEDGKMKIRLSNEIKKISMLQIFKKKFQKI